MMGKSAISYIFKRKEQAVTLATKSSMRVEGERVQVDPQLLSQRLVIACMNSDDEIFKHEICSYLAALFDTPFTLRAPQKATLADTVWAQLSADGKSGPTGSVQYVLDGGALLHRVSWPQQVTYQEVCRLYGQYVP